MNNGAINLRLNRYRKSISIIESIIYTYICRVLGINNLLPGVLITPMALAHPLHPIRSRSKNKLWILWVGWCASSLRPWFWSVHSIYHMHTIYYSCTLSNWNKLCLRDIHTKNVTIMLCWMIWCGYSFLFGFKCIFQLYSWWFSIS